ncbi:MAG: PEP-CTERM sorting domain-containing protein [Pirellulales bacterium]
MKRNISRALRATGCLILVAASLWRPAWGDPAGTTSWQHDPAAPGDWSDAGNWTGGVPEPPSVPGERIMVYVNNGGTAQIGAGSAYGGILFLGEHSTKSGTVELGGGELSSVQEFIGGDDIFTPGGSGRLVQTGGIHTVAKELYVGKNQQSKGIYELSGTGELFSENLFVAYEGDARFTQTGGKNTVRQQLCVGYTGETQNVYELAGGELAAKSEQIGMFNQGRFVHTGGTNTVEDLLELGFDETALGTYELSGTGQLKTKRLMFGWEGTGHLVQTAGSCDVTEDLSMGGYAGLYELGGAGRLSTASVTIGYPLDSEDSNPGGPAANRFVQTGGTHTSDFLNVFTAGSYTISGGRLEAGRLLVDRGAFNLAGPSAQVTVSDLLAFASYCEADGIFTAVPGATVRLVGASLAIRGTAAANLAGLGQAALVFEGGGAVPDTLEAAGHDLGAVPAGFQDNFAVGNLQIGGADAGNVQLVDASQNYASPFGAVVPEALYVKKLVVGPSSFLDLNGLNLYCYGEPAIADSATVLANGGKLIAVPWVPGDADLDVDVDIFDVAVMQTKYGMTGGASWADGDFDRNGTVDILDVAAMQVNYGVGVAGGGPSGMSPVPEPSTLVLAALAAGAMVILARRRWT